MWSFWAPARFFLPFWLRRRHPKFPVQYSDAVGVFADGKLAAFAEPSQLYEQKIWEEAFQVKLCKALDGTYYIKPLERSVLFHAVAPIVSKTGLLQNKNAIAACTKN